MKQLFFLRFSAGKCSSLSIRIYSNFYSIREVILFWIVYGSTHIVVLGILSAYFFYHFNSIVSFQFTTSKGLTCISDPFVEGRLEKSYWIKKICGDIFVIKSLLFLYRYLTGRTCSSVLLKWKRRGAYTASYGSTLRSISGSCKTRTRRSSARTMPILFISRACRADAKATRTLKNCRLYIGKIFVRSKIAIPLSYLFFKEIFRMD